MATIADFRLPVDGFPLGRAIEVDSGIRIELERIVPVEEGVLPFFWIWECSDFERFERTILETQTVTSLEEICRTDGGRLFQARWNPTVEGVIRGITGTGVTIIEGSGTSEGWRFELRFSDRAGVRKFQQYCHENGIPVTLQRVYTVQDQSRGEQYQLTTDQRETIRRAYDRGYFEEPQGVSQTELADEFGVSQRAISRRIRRGLSRLVGSTVGSGDRSSQSRE